MTQMLPVVLMLCAGAAVALQPSINARLAERVGILESACISFAVGAAALFLAVLSSGKGTVRGLPEAAWWEWTGGILGAFFVSATILSVPRIGTAAAMAVSISAQLLTGLLLDHFGILGFGGIQLDTKRMLGTALLLLGAGLIVHR